MSGIALFGGTFNPFHNGHLAVLKAIDTAGFIKNVFLTPNYLSPHKQDDQELINSSHRLEMCERVMKYENFLNISIHINRYEIEKGNISWTIDTLLALKNQFPDDSLYLVLGSDSMLQLHHWKSYIKLIKNSCLFVIKRLSHDNTVLIEYWNQHFSKFSQNKLFISDQLPLKVSSTELRKKLREGKEISNLVPHYIDHYIYQERCYG